VRLSVADAVTADGASPIIAIDIPLFHEIHYGLIRASSALRNVRSGRG
jgi:hypothetical protein